MLFFVKKEGGELLLVPSRLVGIPGFEPGKTEPKPVVLPLHHIPILSLLSLKARQR